MNQASIQRCPDGYMPARDFAKKHNINSPHRIVYFLERGLAPFVKVDNWYFVPVDAVPNLEVAKPKYKPCAWR